MRRYWTIEPLSARRREDPDRRHDLAAEFQILRMHSSGCLRNREATAGLETKYPCQLPPPGQRILPSTQIPASALACRKLPYKGSRKYVRNTAGGYILF